MKNYDATRRSVLRSAGATTLALPLAGCLGFFGDDGEEPEPNDIDPDDIEAGGDLTIGLTGELETLNPLTASSERATAVLRLCYQPGVVVEPKKFEAMAWAFTDWESEETGEGMTISLDVHDDLEWTDGEAFTADDVLFTYEYYIEQEPGRFRSAITPLESVSEGEDADIELTLSEPVGSYAVEQLSLPLLPEHVWSEVDDYTDGPEEIVGLGPGRIEENDDITIGLTENWPLTQQEWVEDHDLLVHGGPFLDLITLRSFGTESALQQAFLDGEIDAISSGEFDASRTETIENRDGLGLVSGHDDGFSGFALNTRLVPFDDQPFRQAMGMTMDETRWVESVNHGAAIPGNTVVPPAYDHIRPETSSEESVQEPGETPATLEALSFRGEDGDPDIEAIREFLESGEVISGSAGEYAGSEYPGSLTDFDDTAQTDAIYDYEFGEVQSELLEAADADAELYVDGQTIEERNDGPLAMLTHPPEERPQLVEFIRRYVEDLRQLGIPIEEEVLTASVMADRVYLDADFAVAPVSFSNVSTRGAPTIYDLFHSNNAGEGGTFAPNAAGYGLDGEDADDAIEQSRGELDEERRNELVRRLAERLYLDAPLLVAGYRRPHWPVNTDEFNGFISDIPGVGGSNLWLQALTIHRR